MQDIRYGFVLQDPAVYDDESVEIIVAEKKCESHACDHSEKSYEEPAPQFFGVAGCEKVIDQIAGQIREQQGYAERDSHHQDGKGIFFQLFGFHSRNLLSLWISCWLHPGYVVCDNILHSIFFRDTAFGVLFCLCRASAETQRQAFAGSAFCTELKFSFGRDVNI